MRLHMNLLEGGRAGAASPKRDTTNDGFRNRAEFYAMTHFRPLWWGIQRFEPTKRWMNRFLINSAVLKIPPRPEPFSTMAPYTSWDSLTDRTYDGRHLPPKPAANPPDVEAVRDLFARGPETRLCPKSTLLFATFAQWFTDGFLRSDRTEPRDYRKNTSNHQIDLCQLYGINPSVTRLLREGSGGRLKADPNTRAPEEFPPRLCTPDGQRVREFGDLAVLRLDMCRKEHLPGMFAIGGDRANTQVGYAMMSVLFFREHNRIAGKLAEAHDGDPQWDDERLFQTTRNILIVLLIKIVIGEYINHISPFHFTFSLDTASLAHESWYRENWMAVEFNLLYRWHSLIPSVIQVNDQDVPARETVFNNDILLKRGLGPLFEDFSHQPAGEIGLFNTDKDLLFIEESSITQDRAVQLATYNDYRVNCGFPRVTDVDQISSDPAIQEALRKTYSTVDDIEFYPGLFAEDRKVNSALPPLIGRMVALDAFSQALTNPLLAPRVFGEKTFSPLGMEIIEETNTLSDILNRNVKAGDHFDVRMTQKDWQRGK